MVLVCFLSCFEKIDAQKWKEKGVDWQLSVVRENSIGDLINSSILKGKTVIQVLN